MSTWSPEDQEEVLVLSTKNPTPRWLKIILKALVVLLALALLVASVVAWRYYAVHQRLKKDLTAVIQEEEHIRSMGGINAVNDMLDPRAPRSWRFRYLSSVRARKGLPEPEIQVESVGYDGINARVELLANGVRQYRHYRLYTGKDWRRAPFVATGWGYKQSIDDAGGFQLIYWDEDAAFAQELADDLPGLTTLMQGLGLTPAVGKLIIIPQELGDLVHPAEKTSGLVINSPHVDLIDAPPPGLTPQQMLRVELGKRIVADARERTPVTSHLPGAARVQNAIDEALAWQWATGDVPDAILAGWANKLKGHWVSPVTGLPPDLITELPPDAPDAAARLMMTWLLRTKGPDALLALSAALPDAAGWDDAYQRIAHISALEVEEAAQSLMKHPGEPVSEKPKAGPGPAPQTVILLTTTPDARGRLLGRTPTGQTVLLEPSADAAFVMVDGSGLDYECVAPGSRVRVQGQWLDEGLRLGFETITLDRAVPPPVLQTPPLADNAAILAWRLREGKEKGVTEVALVEWLPGDVANVLALPDPDFAPFPASFSRPGQPPLLVWRQSVRCNRNWLAAYDPARGIIGAWLAPVDAPQVGAVDYIPGEEMTFLFSAASAATGIRHFRSDEHHVLTPLSPEEWRDLTQSAAHPYRAFLDLGAGAVQAMDLSGRVHSQLYQAAPGEEIPYLIPTFGVENDEVFIASQPTDGPLGLVRVLKVSMNRPGEASLVFEASPRGVITAMALCPDGGYLYGMAIPAEPKPQGVLRLHKPSGEDVAVSPILDDIPAPLYCAKTMQ